MGTPGMPIVDVKCLGFATFQTTTKPHAISHVNTPAALQAALHLHMSSTTILMQCAMSTLLLHLQAALHLHMSAAAIFGRRLLSFRRGMRQRLRHA
jgi:hypothetical protein